MSFIIIINSCSYSKLGDDFSIAAYVQIVILHFQVASLFVTKFQAGQKSPTTTTTTTTTTTSQGDAIRDSIRKLFNFRFSVIQRVCPSDDLTLPEKEMILFGMKLTTFFHLLWLGLLCVLVKAIVYRWRAGKKIPNDVQNVMETMHLEESNDGESSGDVDGALRIVEKSSPQCGDVGLTFVHRLEITFIKFLKMYYTPGNYSKS